jgi:hypothetical protein
MQAKVQKFTGRLRKHHPGPTKLSALTDPALKVERARAVNLITPIAAGQAPNHIARQRAADVLRAPNHIVRQAGDLRPRGHPTVPEAAVQVPGHLLRDQAARDLAAAAAEDRAVKVAGKYLQDIK